MSVKLDSLERWTSRHAADLYHIKEWGGGYFDVSEKGDVLVYPHGKLTGPSIGLVDVIAGLKERGMNMPVLLRICDVLDSRIQQLHESFAKAIREFGYKATYRGVYPIKVNQQQQVVQEVAEFGARYHHGLEAGSKAELIAAISFLQDSEALLVCNGYKDQEFVDLALSSLKMGINCILVIESPVELPLILERAAAIGVRPRIGVRIKLSSRAGGYWSESGGDRSVFGLNTAEVIDVVDRLRRSDMLDCLEMLHYHLGSQVPNIRDIRGGLVEACRIYADLAKEGARMGILDIGGGLAVDYDGSHTNFASSSNYSIDEYCADVIEVIQSSMDSEGVPHPIIVTESGRATVAYYSVLLFNVLDVSRFETHALPEKLPEHTHEMIRNLMEVQASLTRRNLQENFHDALYYRDEIRELFRHGSLTLREKALAEQIFWHIVAKIAREIRDLKYVPDEFENIEAALADIYYCNFSVFQSLPDSWAIQQLFPIMPVHRLNEFPSRSAILADITCDSDGRIDRFVDLQDVRRILPLHEMKAEEEYYLGVFLVGAYQETLGDLHNLLGDTNVVSIRISDSGEVAYSGEIEGDSVADVLSYVEYNPKEMVIRVREMAERAVRDGRITVQERRQIMDAYEAGLRGYTYYEREQSAAGMPRRAFPARRDRWTRHR